MRGESQCSFLVDLHAVFSWPPPAHNSEIQPFVPQHPAIHRIPFSPGSFNVTLEMSFSFSESYSTTAVPQLELAAAVHIPAQRSCQASGLFLVYLAGTVSRSCISVQQGKKEGSVDTLENSNGLLKERGDTDIGS